MMDGACELLQSVRGKAESKQLTPGAFWSQVLGPASFRMDRMEVAHEGVAARVPSPVGRDEHRA